MNITDGNLLAPLGDTSSDPEGYAEGNGLSFPVFMNIYHLKAGFQLATLMDLESTVKQLEAVQEAVDPIFRLISSLKPLLTMAVDTNRYDEYERACKEITNRHFCLFSRIIQQMPISVQQELNALVHFLETSIFNVSQQRIFQF